MSFNNEKKVFLSKIDKSKAQQVDKEILPLVEKINKNRDYYTTSSCSGRILLLQESEKKNKVKWLLKSHAQVSLKQIRKSLAPMKNLWFRIEPAILHVSCRNKAAADTLLKQARSVGFKRGGLISFQKNTLELISTESLNTIIMKNKKLLVDDSYLRVLIQEANQKLKNTRKKIKKFIQ